MTSKLFNQEAEQAVLGAILVEGSLIHECTLLPVHFSPGSHQLIFKRCGEWKKAGKKLILYL
ncbi:DnaB-like helicase N-terminal domain-containing protein [Schinkia azotoformans]|nr:DnaB-like helicase N-terminal domain-containing protein [Schinkia azotoformans]MEC1716994.1 DnaB-like helicase N-terminal domain-containing protein [Schinkia azotoformans]MEC1747825.1 DnaB-like helicase N-terminal domain-containing protein [Schinkia azotoformans]